MLRGSGSLPVRYHRNLPILEIHNPEAGDGICRAGRAPLCYADPDPYHRILFEIHNPEPGDGLAVQIALGHVKCEIDSDPDPDT
jgi:hypothetical protein